MEEKLAKAVRKRRMEQDVVVSSFHEPVLLRMKELEPSIGTCAFVLMGPEETLDLPRLEELGVSMVVAGWKNVKAEDVKALHERGMIVRSGLPDNLTLGETVQAVRRLASIGLDEIASGGPDLIAAVLAKKDNTLLKSGS